MKAILGNKYLFISAVLACTLTWVGCNKGGKINQASTFQRPTGPIELKLKWPEGEKIVQEMTQKQTTDTDVPGQPAPFHQDTIMGQQYQLTVLKALPDGGHQVEMEFLNAKVQTVQGGKTVVDFDSTKSTPPSGKPNPMAEVLGKLVGCKLNFSLNASNQVDRVEGIEELQNRLFEGGGTGGIGALIKGIYNEGYFKQIMDYNRFLPAAAVKPGDTWPVQYEVPLGPMGTLVMNLNITLQSWETHGKRECARLEYEGTLQTKQGSSMAVQGISMTLQDGNVTGISWFDPELGMVIDTSMNQDITMIMTVPVAKRNGAPKNLPTSMTLTNQIKQNLEYKFISVK